MNQDKVRPTFTYTEDRLSELRAVVPEAFPDGVLDWDTLREALGAFLPDGDARAEHFGLNWPGKREARRLAAKPSHGALHPALGEGVAEDATHNLFLEGDNLEVLKLLQKAYAGRVKMIYIDPPYNTGNDFVYKDDYSEPLADYLRRSGQTGAAGELLTSNPKSGGRFHSNWLNMMYPRLRLARTLLRDDGVIFISIDDNEVHNLRQLMDEVFGAENFSCEIIIRANSRGQTYKQIAKTHEYLLIYSRETDAELLELEKIAEKNDLDYTDAISSFSVRELRNRNPKFGRHNRPNLFYPVFVDTSRRDKDGFYPVSLVEDDTFSTSVEPFNSRQIESCWRWGKPLFAKSASIDTQKSNVVAKRKQDGTYGIYEKYRKTTFKPKSIWDENTFLTETGTVQLRNLGMADAFPFPKPVELVKRCIMLSTCEDDIIVDFFSGSATTAQAVMEVNREDGGSRQYILTQVPETTTHPNGQQPEFNTLTEIGKERIRRVIARMQTQPPLVMRDMPEDLGFKVFKLGPSSFKEWKDYEGNDPTVLQTLFDDFESPLVPNWKALDLLTEVLLLEGFPLDSSVEPQPLFIQNIVFHVASPSCGHCLWVCFDLKIEDTTLDDLLLPPGDVFVCLDAALNDDTKVRLMQAGSLRTI